MAAAKKKVVLPLPADLAAKLTAAEVKRDTLQNILDTVAGTGAGVDLTAQTAVDYLLAATNDILTAALEVNDCQMKVLALAKETGGYDPATCTAILDTVAGTGAVTWTAAQEDGTTA